MVDNENSIYGNHLPELERVMQFLVNEINDLRQSIKNEVGDDPVEHLNCRIKSEASMREKCIRKGLSVSEESALKIIHDAVGIRVVCAFLNDVYTVRDHLIKLPNCKVVEEKDYIKHAKANGYRSYHLVLLVDEAIYAEIQLRTISQDTWAALEHQIHYKKVATDNDALIISELKRCADELASTDISMQTIRDMIRKA